MVQSETIKELLTDTTQKMRKKSRINFNYSPELLKKYPVTSAKKQSPLLEPPSPAPLPDTSEITKNICCFECNFRLKQSKHAPDSSPDPFDDSPHLPVTFHALLCSFLQRSLRNFLRLLIFILVYIATFVSMIFLLSNGFRQTRSYHLPASTNNTHLNYTSVPPGSMKCAYCYLNVWLITSSLALIWPVYIVARLFKCRGNSSNSLTSGGVVKKPKSLRLLMVTSFRGFYILPKHNHKELVGPTRNRLKSDFFFKVLLITALWLTTGYTFLSALSLIRISDVVILYAINVSLSYMIRWIVLHYKFVPMRLLGFVLDWSK